MQQGKISSTILYNLLILQSSIALKCIHSLTKQPLDKKLVRNPAPRICVLTLVQLDMQKVAHPQHQIIYKKYGNAIKRNLHNLIDFIHIVTFTIYNSKFTL